VSTSSTESRSINVKNEGVPERSSRNDPIEASSKSFLQEASILSRPSVTASSSQRWNKLKDSLELQENLYSSRMNGGNIRYPPDSLPLNEAFEAGREANQNVTVNAQKVGSYMSKLQDYLEVILIIS